MWSLLLLFQMLMAGLSAGAGCPVAAGVHPGMRVHIVAVCHCLESKADFILLTSNPWLMTVRFDTSTKCSDFVAPDVSQA
jgi:hypothetical protein